MNKNKSLLATAPGFWAGKKAEGKPGSGPSFTGSAVCLASHCVPLVTATGNSVPRLVARACSKRGRKRGSELRHLALLLLAYPHVVCLSLGQGLP